jgi:hypothetical protein
LPEKFNKELDQLNQMEAPGVAGRA